MSLNRIMLRIGVVSALSQQPYDDVPPTMAGEMVFDSRLDDIEFRADGRIELPIIQVYTEEDEAVSYSNASAGMDDYDRHVNLRIEFAISSFLVTTGEDAKQVVEQRFLSTDATLEALLDIFEWQILRTLRHPLREASVAVQNLVMNWGSWTSQPFRSNDKNNRLAGRVLTMRTRIKPDCGPRVDVVDQILPSTDTSVPVFPDAPYLNPLIAILAKKPENKDLLAALREIATGTASLKALPLRRVSVSVDQIDPADDSLIAALNRTTGPDGQIDLYQEWTL